MSWDRSHGNVKRYARNRFLRLYPALFSSFIVLQLILTIFGHINFHSFSDFQMWIYYFGQLTIFQFFTPDCLRGFGYGCPNGSLWTIPVEIEFYILIPLILMALKGKWNNSKIISLGICSIAYNAIVFFLCPESMGAHKSSASDLISLILSGDLSPLIKVLNVTCIPYLYSFLLGALIYRNWERLKVIFVNKFLLWIVAYLTISLLFDFSPAYYIKNPGNIVANLLLGCVTISAAFSYTQKYNVLRGNDISYGVYIWHGIVLNVFREIGLIGSLQYYIWALFLTLFIAILSWRAIEKPMLNKK